MVNLPDDRARVTSYGVLLAISVSHLLNDTLQSLIPAIYPVVKDGFHLSFAQVGLITLAFQLTASLLQPFVGAFTDRRPQPYSLAAVMGKLADLTNIAHVFQLSAFLPLLGLIAAFLPNLESQMRSLKPART